MGKGIQDEGIAIGAALPGVEDQPAAGDHQNSDGEAGHRVGGVGARIGADHQQRQRADGKDQLWRRERQAGEKVRRHGSQNPWVSSPPRSARRRWMQ